MVLAWLLAAAYCSYLTVAVAQVLTGMSTASLTVVSSYVSEHTPEMGRAKAFAHMLAARGLGQMLGPLVVAATLGQGTSTVCVLLVVPTAVTAAAAALLRDSRPAVGAASRTCAHAASWLPWAVAVPLLSMMLLYASPSSVSSYVPVYAKAGFGASPEKLAALFSLLGLTMVLTPALLHLLERCCTEPRAAVLCYLAMAASIAGMAAAPTLWALVMVYFGWALLWDVTYPYVKAHLSRQAPAHQQPRVQAAVAAPTAQALSAA